MSLRRHRCCARLKILEQAQTFSVSPIITPFGFCIHRKAINKDKHLSCGWYPTTGRTATCKAKWFILFIALARMVTFCKEGGGMLSVWALRARSYKTRAEA